MSTDTLAATGEIRSPVKHSLANGASTGTIDTTESADAADAGESSGIGDVADGTLCGNCNACEDWDGMSCCPSCGYHPALKRCVNVQKPAGSNPWESTARAPENLWEAIPQWAWILLGGVAAVVGLSVAVRWQLDGSARLRAGWAFTQAAIAEFATLVVHVLALIHASTTSDRYSPFDLFMRPLELWKPTLAALPRYAWRVWVFVWAQTAMICAVAIIGGLDYSALFDDWGVEKRTAPNMVQAIVDQARQNGLDADSLEDALNNTADASEDLMPGDEAASSRPTVECLIIGYRTFDGEITSLLLATTVRSQMSYVGIVSTENISETEMKRLAERMPQLEQSKPFVKCRYQATWLRPRLMCEVEYDKWKSGDILENPNVRRMLSDVEVR